MTNTTVDIKAVEKLAEILDKTNLTEIEYDMENVSIRLTRTSTVVTAPAVAVAAAPVLPVSTKEESSTPDVIDDYSSHQGVVKSPMVGVIYMASEPSAPKYIKEGDIVTAGQTLLLIEAMKTFNPVLAPRGGKVTKIFVEDGMPVEFDEPLLILE
ncbi:MAG: acetyl-CoA carboxylase biotin carboxyl carrier protein [Alphaproteobacteria bacterium]|nr:acetyl-CoA carboxylase biotin carboxyl carrier protein [Alphaproteobacteria bacterium]